MARLWRNWSGSLLVQPRMHAKPRDEAGLAAAVRAAHARGRTVRAVATGHSSHEMLRGDDVLLDLRGLRGVLRNGQIEVDQQPLCLQNDPAADQLSRLHSQVLFT